MQISISNEGIPNYVFLFLCLTLNTGEGLGMMGELGVA